MRVLQSLSRGLLGMLFVFAGVQHFRRPGFYASMMPPYVPWHPEMVFVSGVCEIALGLLLFVPRYRLLARWGLIALLVAVFPANVQMALHPELFPEVEPWILWARLPLQALLIAWAWFATRSRAYSGLNGT